MGTKKVMVTFNGRRERFVNMYTIMVLLPQHNCGFELVSQTASGGFITVYNYFD